MVIMFDTRDPFFTMAAFGIVGIAHLFANHHHSFMRLISGTNERFNDHVRAEAARNDVSVDRAYDLLEQQKWSTKSGAPLNESPVLITRTRENLLMSRLGFTGNVNKSLAWETTR